MTPSMKIIGTADSAVLEVSDYVGKFTALASDVDGTLMNLIGASEILNPALWTGTRASQFLMLFDEYRVEKAVFHVVAANASTKDGQAIFFMDADPEEIYVSGPIVIRQAFAHKSKAVVNAWETAKLFYQQDKQDANKFVDLSKSDRLTSFGLLCGVVTSQFSANAGWTVWVDLKLRLSKAQLEPSTQASSADLRYTPSGPASGIKGPLLVPPTISTGVWTKLGDLIEESAKNFVNGVVIRAGNRIIDNLEARISAGSNQLSVKLGSAAPGRYGLTFYGANENDTVAGSLPSATVANVFGTVETNTSGKASCYNNFTQRAGLNPSTISVYPYGQAYASDMQFSLFEPTDSIIITAPSASGNVTSYKWTPADYAASVGMTVSRLGPAF